MSSFVQFGRRCAQALAGVALAGLLTACGGGGASSGTPVLGGGTGGTGASTATDLAVLADKTTVPNSGAEVVTFTVTALTAGNAALTGVATPVDFVVDAGAIVTPSGKTTSTDTGKVTAVVQLVDKTNRTVKLKVTSGSIVRTVSFDVVESTAVIPSASDLTMSLNATSVGNSGGDTVNVVVTAVDKSRNAVAGITVIFSVDNNAVLVVGNSVTDGSGQAKAAVTIGADRSNRTVTVTATSGTLVRQAAFKVSGAKLQASLQPATLNAGVVGQVEYTLTDVNSTAMADAAITVTGPGAVTKTDKTDSKGKYIYRYTAVGNGPTLITSTAGGASVVSTVQINANVPVVPAATNIASVTFTASPVVVSVNAVGSTDNRSELRLIFLGDKNLPVPNARVRIGFGTNNSGTDADISSGKDQVVYSDANGVAVVSLIAGQRSSPTDQVVVYACFAKDDTVPQITATPPAVPCAPSNLRSVSLTVVEQPVSISIGTNALVAAGTSGLTYIQQFTVLVVDAAGNPKAGVQVAPVIDLPTYRKGFYTYDNFLKQWVQTVAAICLNEDSSLGTGYRNGTIETGEDLNNNGQLDPRKSDASIALVGTTTTDANGLAVLRVEYPQSVGSWAEFSIRVSASGVLSPPAWTGRLASEGSTVLSLTGTARVLPVPITVIKADGEPPFRISPYGANASCSSPN